MAVRFMPDRPAAKQQTEDRGDLAEVIDIRSRIVKEADFDETFAADESEERDAKETEPKLEIREYATRALARKALSSGELAAKLGEAGYEDYSIEEIVEDFKQSLYLDDTGMARILSEKLRTSKKASAQQVRQALQKRLFPQEAILEVISEIDEEEQLAILYETAHKQARKMRDLDKQTATRRLYGFLSRRGWGGSELSKAVKEAIEGSADGQ